MDNRSLNLNEDDLESLAKSAIIETIIVFFASFFIGEFAFQINLFGEYHRFPLIINALITTFLFFEASAIFLGASKKGKRKEQMLKMSFIRWSMLAIGPIITMIIVRL
jgi:hypothetical protein